MPGTAKAETISCDSTDKCKLFRKMQFIRVFPSWCHFNHIRNMKKQRETERERRITDSSLFRNKQSTNMGLTGNVQNESPQL